MRTRAEKVKPKMAEIEGNITIRRQLSPLRDQRSLRNIYTIQFKESKVETFNFGALPAIAGELTAVSHTKD